MAKKLMDLSKKADDNYLYIYAIKEMLKFSDKEFPNLPDLISFLFQRGEENAR